MKRQEALDKQVKGEKVFYVPEGKIVQISQLPYPQHKEQTWVCISITDERGVLIWTKKADLSEISEISKP